MKQFFLIACFFFLSLFSFSQKCLRTLTGHTGFLTGLSVLPGSRQIASVSTDKTLKIWDASSGSLFNGAEAHKTPVYEMAAAPSGKWLATGGWDFSIKVWDATTGSLQKELTNVFTSRISGISIGSDDAFLAVSSGDSVKVYETATWKLESAWKAATSDISGLSFSPCGKWLALAGWDGSIVLYDSKTFRVSGKLTGHTGALRAFVFSPDGRYMASASDDKTIRIWDVDSCRQLSKLRGDFGSAGALAFSPDGAVLAVAGAGAAISLIEFASESLLSVLNGHTRAVTCLSFSPNGQYLASGSEDQMIRLWDMTDLKYKKCIDEKLGPFAALNSPKDEFETTEQYKQRLEEYARKSEEAKKSCITEEAILKEEYRQFREEEKAAAYSWVSLGIDEIGIYDADKQEFEIVIDDITYQLSMPVKEAKTFKPYWQKAEVAGIQRTDPSGNAKEYINLLVIHPETGQEYPVGKQVQASQDKSLEIFLKNNPRPK